MQDDTLHPTPTRRTRERPAARPWRCPRDASCRSPVYHDSGKGYGYGCRSGAARLARSRYEQARVAEGHRRIDATGTIRRLRALHAIGHSDARVGVQLGVSRKRVGQLRGQRGGRVLRDTADNVALLYLEWSEADPPPGWQTDRTLKEAIAAGEEPPAAWDLASIDDPAVLPWKYERPTLPNHHEELLAARTERVAVLTRARYSALEISLRLGVSQRTVNRLRVRAVEHGLLAPDAAEPLEESA